MVEISLPKTVQRLVTTVPQAPRDWSDWSLLIGRGGGELVQIGGGPPFLCMA